MKPKDRELLCVCIITVGKCQAPFHTANLLQQSLQNRGQKLQEMPTLFSLSINVHFTTMREVGKVVAAMVVHSRQRSQVQPLSQR